MRRLILGCSLAAFFGGAIAVAQSPITSTKPLVTPGLNQPLLVPPATTSKNSPSATGSGLGLGAQSVPGISPVTNPQASKGGSGAESVPPAETRTPSQQRLWNPSNFRMNVDGLEKSTKRPAKVETLTVKQSTKSDQLGSARDYAEPPAETKKGEGAPAKFKSAKPKTMESELIFDGFDYSNNRPTPKVAPPGNGPHVAPGLPPAATLPATRKTVPGLPAAKDTKGSWDNWYVSRSARRAGRRSAAPARRPERAREPERAQAPHPAASRSRKIKTGISKPNPRRRRRNRGPGQMRFDRYAERKIPEPTTPYRVAVFESCDEWVRFAPQPRPGRRGAFAFDRGRASDFSEQPRGGSDV
jgi:hypothetical protein